MINKIVCVAGGILLSIATAGIIEARVNNNKNKLSAG